VPEDPEDGAPEDLAHGHQDPADGGQALPLPPESAPQEQDLLLYL